VALLSSNLYKQQGLVSVSNFHVVGLQEIFSHRYLFSIVVFKEFVQGIFIKNDVTYNVSLLVSPVGNDTLAFEFVADSLFIVVRIPLVDLIDSFQA
jgi:hypothetical protein